MNWVAYSPGDGTLFVVDAAALWVGADLPEDFMKRMWALLVARQAPVMSDDVIELLASTYGLRSLPDFVMVEVVDGAPNVILRGVEAQVIGPDGSRQVTAMHRGPWTVHEAHGARRVVIGPATGPRLPVVTGVVRSSGMFWSEDASDSTDEGAVGGESDELAEPVDLDASESHPVADIAVVVPEAEHEVAAQTVDAHPESDHAENEDEVDDVENGYTTLFRRHQTPRPDVQTVVEAVPPTPAPPSMSDEPPGAPTADLADPTESVDSQTRDWPDAGLPSTAPRVATRPTGLIDGIPGFSTPVGTPQPVTASASVLKPQPPTATIAATTHPTPTAGRPPSHAATDDDGLTIPRPAGAPIHRTTPEVLASRCREGHLNPAHADSCRVCSGDIPAQEPQWITRPSLGRMLLPRGEALDIDRGIVFGRAPHEPDSSHERPHLINISSYGPHLSRMHLEVILDGWFVLARDLGSTSGTVLTVPGRDPERLRAHELVTLQPGCLLDLAGDYQVRFEVTR